MECLKLTAAALADLVEQGWEVLGSGHVTEDECLANCGGSSGSSSASGSDDDACCPGVTEATEFTATLHAVGGECDCLDGLTALLTFNPLFGPAGAWQGSIDLTADCDTGSIGITMQCARAGIEPVWQIDLTGCASDGGAQRFFDCDPFLVRFPGDPDSIVSSLCCPVPGDFYITITEA